MADLYPITVDTREKTPPSEVRVRELEACGVPAVLGLLPVGDYHWVVSDGDTQRLVFVERKAIADLLSSAEDGRLTRFIDETGGLDPDPTVLRAVLLEGDQFVFGTYGYKQWTPEQVDNLLVSLQSSGVLLLRSSSVRQTASRLAAFWKYTGREDHRSLLRVLRPSIGDGYMNMNKKAAVRFLMGLPNWGEKTAREVLEAMGSDAAVVKALLEDPTPLLKVKGVGKLTVKNAQEFLANEF